MRLTLSPAKGLLGRTDIQHEIDGHKPPTELLTNPRVLGRAGDEKKPGIPIPVTSFPIITSLAP
jgi:hypothetical protein